MFIRILLVVIGLFGSSASLVGQQAPLCEEHAWFRTPIALSPLCRGVRDAAFDRRSLALKHLKTVIDKAPQSAESYRAHEAILQMEFRDGFYHEALAEADLMLTIRKDAKDIIELRPLLVSLSAFPAMSVVRRHSYIPNIPVHDANPHFPVLVNSKEALYFMDTGANISVMSDAEAQALGLSVQSVTSKIADISGKVTSLRVTEVEMLQIGKTLLRHVCFIVLPATNPPFDALPIDQQAILGIQVLRSLERIRVERNGRIELAGPRARPSRSTPMVFYQSIPVVQMESAGRTLLYTLDTGAVHTLLNPTFAKTFPDALSDGTGTNHVLNGLGRSTYQRSIELRKASFLLAGQPVTLSPAMVLLDTTTNTSEWTGGNLGYDLIQQIAPFTLDFHSMTFSSE